MPRLYRLTIGISPRRNLGYQNNHLIPLLFLQASRIESRLPWQLM